MKNIKRFLSISMIIVRSKYNVPIRLTTERWGHITRRHPEMDNQKTKVLETLLSPNIIFEGDFGELIAAKFFTNTPLTQKYLICVYRETSKDDGFILTAYFTDKLLDRRKILWKQ